MVWLKIEFEKLKNMKAILLLRSNLTINRFTYMYVHYLSLNCGKETVLRAYK